VNDTYEKPISVGVRGKGSISADVIAYDPTDATHQFVAAAFNAGDEHVGRVTLGASAKTVSVKYIITKFPVSLKAASAVTAKLEAVITEIADLPES